MLKTSKVPRTKSITTRTKVKVITTSSTRKSRYETASITKKLLKPSTITPFTSLCTPPTSTSLPTTTSSTTTSKSLLYPTLSLPHSSLPTSTSSSSSSSPLLSSLSSLSTFISLPFTTIFNLQSQQQQQQQQPQQELQLESFIIAPHLHQQFKNPFHSLTRPFQRKLLSQSNVFHSTKIQFKNELKSDSEDLSHTSEETDTTPNLTPAGITFKHLNSNEFKAAMEEFELEARNNPIEALLTFTGAVAKHYPLEPLEFVTKFIRANRTIFEQLFQYQIVQSIPSLKSDDTAERDEIDAKQVQIDEIVEIIFQWYQNIPTLISQLRDQKYTDKEIGSLLRTIYPKHFHKEIDAVLLPQVESDVVTQQIRYALPKTIKIDGRDVLIYLETDPDDDEPMEFIQGIFDSIQPLLSNHQEYIDAINTTCDSFVQAFRHPEIQKVIQEHKNDWYSNPHYSHKILQFLSQLYSPPFIPLTSSIVTTARHDEDDKNATSEFYDATDAFMKSIIKFRTENYKSNPIILPLQHTHLALSSQQVLILMSARCLIKAKKGKKISRDEKLIFQLLTGLTLENYLKQNPNSKAWSLIVYGAQGLGKSLLLLLLFIASLFNVDWSNDNGDNEKKQQEKKVQKLSDNGDVGQVNNNDENETKSRVDILTCQRAKHSEDASYSFQVEGRKNHYGQIESMYFRNRIIKEFQHKGLSTHFYDIPDSPNPRDVSKANLTQTPSIDPAPTHVMIQNGIEIRFLSAQERIPRWWDQHYKIRYRYGHPVPEIKPRWPLLSLPTFLLQPPSPIQTTLSIIKSSLYQHYFKLSPRPTMDQLSSFLSELNKLTINDLYDIGLFNEWDNGQSLNIDVESNQTAAPTTLTTEYPQSFMNLEYVSDLIHIVPPNQRRIPKGFIVKLIATAFNRQQNRAIQPRLSQLIYELRLLPYVSSSMRSASNFYALLNHTTTTTKNKQTTSKSRISRYDLFTRFFPIPFSQSLSSSQEKVTTSQQDLPEIAIGTVTQFSKFALFLAEPQCEELINSSTTTPITIHLDQQQSQGKATTNGVEINLQKQLDLLPTIYYSTSLHNYFVKDPQTYFAQKYAPHCTHHYYIDTTSYDLTKPITISTTVNQTGMNLRTRLNNAVGFHNRSTFEPPNQPLFLPIPTIDQSKAINSHIIDAIKFVHHTHSAHHKPITVYFGTAGQSNYPAFDNALIYFHQDSTTNHKTHKIQIGIHFVQITVKKSRTQPNITATSVDLYNKIIEIEKALGIEIVTDSWSVLSPFSLKFSSKIEKKDKEQTKQKDEEEKQKDEKEKKEQDEEEQDEVVVLNPTLENKIKIKLPYLSKPPIHVIPKTLQ